VNDEEPQIRAGGGIVHRRRDDGAVEVLIIHRPKYQDWTLPKGKLDPGESVEEAAIREVEEETGIRCVLGEHAGSNFYRDRHNRTKRVDYWLMEPEGDVPEFEVNEEVDEILWLTPEEASDRLTHDWDSDLVANVSVD
jgi:8-oxo-dGTP diphosphatase